MKSAAKLAAESARANRKIEEYVKSDNHRMGVRPSLCGDLTAGGYMMLQT